MGITKLEKDKRRKLLEYYKNDICESCGNKGSEYKKWCSFHGEVECVCGFGSSGSRGLRSVCKVGRSSSRSIKRKRENPIYYLEKEEKDRALTSKVYCFKCEAYGGQKKCTKCGAFKCLCFFTAQDPREAKLRCRCSDCLYEYSMSFEGRFINIKACAKKRGVEFNITKAEALAYYKEPCACCGESQKSFSLGRVAVAKGYDADNIFSCCQRCSIMKLDHSLDVFLDRVRVILDLGNFPESQYTPTKSQLRSGVLLSKQTYRPTRLRRLTKAERIEVVRLLSEEDKIKCAKCDRVKSSSAFYKRTGSLTGRQPSCRECDQAAGAVFRKSPRGRWKAVKGSIKMYREVKGLASNLTLEYFLSFWNLSCTYCGCAIETIGIDRLDSSRGYMKTNLVPCCTMCNKMKGALTVNEFKAHLTKISGQDLYRKCMEVK